MEGRRLRQVTLVILHDGVKQSRSSRKSQRYQWKMIPSGDAEQLVQRAALWHRNLPLRTTILCKSALIGKEENRENP
jgi:hypothetical protein